MIFGNNTERVCALCEFGTENEESGNILCSKHRNKEFEPEHRCHKFTYDPLKKKPHRKPALMQHSEDEFRLD